MKKLSYKMNFVKLWKALIFIVVVGSLVYFYSRLPSLYDFDEVNRGDASVQIPPSDLFIKTRFNDGRPDKVGIGAHYGANDFSEIFSFPANTAPYAKERSGLIFGWGVNNTLLVATRADGALIKVPEKWRDIRIHHVIYKSYYDQFHFPIENFTFDASTVQFKSDNKINERDSSICELLVDGSTKLSSDRISFSLFFDVKKRTVSINFNVLPVLSRALNMSLTGVALESIHSEPLDVEQSSMSIKSETVVGEVESKDLSGLLRGGINLLLSFDFGVKSFRLNGDLKDNGGYKDFDKCLAGEVS